MANIMINKVCNLQCQYCFANKFVNTETCKDENNITIENFKKALDFAVSDSGRIGIIGGEPLLHPDFKELMKILFDDNRVEHITLFTNGINLNKYYNIISNPKVSVLINLNSPKMIGEENYKKTIENIDYLVNELYLKSKISIGINMYKKDFDYEYMINALNRYNLKYVRTSIVVPNTDDKRTSNAIEYFKIMKEQVFKFFKACEENNIVAHYDCNLMPQCVLDEDERKWILKYAENSYKNCGTTTNIIESPTCNPVIDILPNLKAVRCFGCSDESVDISKFYNINDLKKYFINNIDNYANLLSVSTECTTCYYKHTSKCSGGCIAFKNKKIIEAKNKIKEIDKVC